jgi:hypothetical protein
MVSSTSTKVQSITSEETGKNKSSSSEGRLPNSAYRSPQPMRKPIKQEVSEEFYQEKSQEKTLLQRPDFFLLRSPHD